MRQHTAVIALFLFGGLFVLGLLALAWAIGPSSSEAQEGTMQNCPQPNKWAISVWDGNDGTDVEQALATCGEGAMAVAYSIDPDTQAWRRWFADRPSISNLDILDNMQGVMALGGTQALASPTATPTPSPTATPTPAPPAAADMMRNCPLQGKWAISVWDGDDGTDAEQALATCGEGTVAVAYSIDPETQAWRRWFADRPGISNLATLSSKQGILALGGAEAPATPTPTATPTVGGGPPTDYVDTFHAAFEMSMGGPLAEVSTASEGDFEAPDRCSCHSTVTAGSGAFEHQSERDIIIIGDQAWIDKGDGWSETTLSEKPGLAGFCPACPSFWKDYSLQPPPVAGEDETKNGVPAIHYSAPELCEAFLGVGGVPEELDGASIDACDIWLAADQYWLVGLDLGISQPPGEPWDWTSVTMTIDINQTNDPSIEVNAP